jgi:hypothetical protein
MFGGVCGFAGVCADQKGGKADIGISKHVGIRRDILGCNNNRSPAVVTDCYFHSALEC